MTPLVLVGGRWAGRETAGGFGRSRTSEEETGAAYAAIRAGLGDILMLLLLLLLLLLFLPSLPSSMSKKLFSGDASGASYASVSRSSFIPICLR